ncbi:MNIO family bufferin maturase [Rickettsia endosymbiont of Cardiosporidium cionae]|uniref:MNIO family bufferin maturase n=1 Tax=Rickettsia endosymbiont of Cardiosporidium cionae TaxID=2777155 RepID=UPI001895412D|nr:DUF692 domain-containing protein [Rickettsia endosymbiont of Cardiosporidium cionae]KAF8818535.1 hypothetical protein IHI24_000251 [Rickettsia endosymbiont of Cardiosporidium cionae]
MRNIYKKLDLVGIGLRLQHFDSILKDKPKIGWLEVHSENFFSYTDDLKKLYQIAKIYKISLHGIGLSLGSAELVSETHLARVKQLIEYIDPFLVSEHLSWSSTEGVYFPDLLPIVYNQHSFNQFCKNITRTQEFLQREILIENPSSYLEYQNSDQDEVEFLVSLAQKSGAKILLDVNNLFVSATNHKWDPYKYIDTIPKNLVHEIHLAGHSKMHIADNEVLLIDTHDHFVDPKVWQLYSYAIRRFGSTYTLVEWDENIPTLQKLIEESYKAMEFN